jgi:2-haloacid dehalogenase
MNARWASFDCYGTLVDWDSGLRSKLAALFPNANPQSLLDAYHRHEPEIQSGRGIPYRDVMAEALLRVAVELGAAVPPGCEDALAESLPTWPVFPEVPGALTDLRNRGWRMAILSNTDPDLLAASIERIGVPVEGTITAAEAGSYKPAHGHWERFFERFDADREQHVHVAASVFHDLEPAAELGLQAVWINRRHEVSDAPRAAELKDLSRLPEVVESLVPVEPEP